MLAFHSLNWVMHQACILTKSISNRVGFTRPQVAQLTMYKECVIMSEVSPILYIEVLWHVDTNRFLYILTSYMNMYLQGFSEHMCSKCTYRNNEMVTMCTLPRWPLTHFGSFWSGCLQPHVLCFRRPTNSVVTQEPQQRSRLYDMLLKASTKASQHLTPVLWQFFSHMVLSLYRLSAWGISTEYQVSVGFSNKSLLHSQGWPSYAFNFDQTTS